MDVVGLIHNNYYDVNYKMKNKEIIGFTILSIFILCSLSYQPIIANETIENTSFIKDNKKTVFFGSIRWNFPFICATLFIVYQILYFIWETWFWWFRTPPILRMLVERLAEIIGCDWASDFNENIFTNQFIINKTFQINGLNNNDCGCNDYIDWNFPIICSVLGVFWLITMILCVSMNQREFCDIAISISDMMTNLNCGK